MEEGRIRHPDANGSRGIGFPWVQVTDIVNNSAESTRCCCYINYDKSDGNFKIPFINQLFTSLITVLNVI